ncbi:hypothetical protein [Cohnella soli]|uniref:YtkA-like domain-containing protein n=1 Tax=Cohnella soli TaxID=425005 RepID=A0ABW0HZZ9_9BACL
MRKKCALLLIALALTIGLMSGCASGGKPQKLKFEEVDLSSDPASPLVGKNAKLTVHVNNSQYAKQEAEVQLQINSNDTLPQLIDATPEGETYVASYAFPQAGTYHITVHMSYEDEHYAYAKSLEVGK